MAKDQMFSQMDQVALRRLEGRNPRLIAEKAGIDYDARHQIFRFSSLGMDLTVDYPSYRITPTVSGWHRLLILHYLDLADGFPLTGPNISFSQMKDGMVRGGGIDRKCEMAFRQMQHEQLDTLCQAIGGQKVQTNADVSYLLPFLPRFPVTLKVWLPDEEYPASGRLLVDFSADHYLTIEDAVTVAEILIEKITVPKEQQTFSTQ